MFTVKTKYFLVTCIIACFIGSCKTKKEIVKQHYIPAKIETTEDVPTHVFSGISTERKTYYQTIMAEPELPGPENTEMVPKTDVPVSVQSEVKPQIKPEPASERIKQKTSSPKQGNFLVVTGSFTNRKNAVELAEEFTRNGYAGVALQYTGGLYRVVVKKFTEEQPARIFLTKFKNEHPKYSDAWLYFD